MDYEKLYKDALEKARQLCAYPTSRPFISDLQDLFPELKESEDELTWLTNYIEEEAYYLSMDIRDNEDRIKLQELQKSLAWLNSLKEKPQGKSALEAIKEDKADNDIKIKPKFKVGQWIVWQDKCYKVNDNGCGYELVDQNGLSTSLEYGTIDENAHIWDIIKDAKDGDVLVSRSPFIYGKLCPYGGLSGVIFIKASNFIFTDSPVHPATKEERDFLFQRMKEAGYKWDTNNKQLIKL